MKYIVAANWKMNPPDWKSAKALFDATKKAADRAKKSTVIVAPPALYLQGLRERYKGRRIAFAAQNAHFAESGAHTGELSMGQYVDAGAQYVIIGHAERRGLGETNEDTGKKVAAAISADLIPIFCVGEKERGGVGDYFTTVKEQLRAGLSSLQSIYAKKVIVTYEPLWTIGKDVAMSPHQMHEMAIYIRKTVVDMHGEVGHSVKILYGGSIDDESAPAMLTQGDVVGLLVGRASEDAEKIEALLEAIEKVK